VIRPTLPRARAGLVVTDRDWLIHSPRMISTLVALGLRKLLGTRADRPIRALLAAFALLGRLPTRRYSACFLAAPARKPAAGEARRDRTGAAGRPSQVARNLAGLRGGREVGYSTSASTHVRGKGGAVFRDRRGRSRAATT
jgi:hypothetical protein